MNAKSIIVEWRGQIKPLAQWGRELNISGSTLRSRFERGMRGDLLFKQGQVLKKDLECAGLRNRKTSRQQVRLALIAFTQGKKFVLA